MTCIAAVKKAGQVVIGGDSLLSTGSDKKAGVRKITKFPGCYVGFAGMYAIRHVLDNLARDKGFLSSFKMDCIEDARDLARRVFEELETDVGEKARDDINETALLVATSTQIFEIDSDITCVEHDDYTAIGSGARPAKAVFEVLNTNFPLTPPRECVTIALEVATKLDLLCGGPYYVYEVENESAPAPRPSRTPRNGSKPTKSPRTPKSRTGSTIRNISGMSESDSPPGSTGKSGPKYKIPKRSNS
jgi:ATP-dependent protease HslVU (ClpYQ) peptidase subunit